MQEGDIVICTLDSGYNKYITEGKQYTVVNHTDTSNAQVEIITNNCSCMWFFEYRFTSIPNYRRIKLEKIKERICNQVIK